MTCEIPPKQVSPQGSGSGLDADKLDGNEAAAFALASHSHVEADISDLGTTIVLDTDIGTTVQAFGEALDDLSVLGAPGSADLFIVSTGAGAFAYESGAAARASMGAGTGDGTVDTTGTPANNQIAIFTDADTIEGVSALTWDGTTFNVDGGLLVNDAGADRDSRIEGDTLAYMLFLEANAASENIALLGVSLPGWQSMDRGLFLGAVSTEPTGNPSGGCFIWYNLSDGKLKVRLSGGDIIELAGPV